MSIPGLGQAAPAAAALAPVIAATVIVVQLQAQSEWRFEVPTGQKIEIRVLSGTAEIFGTELAVSHVYTFRRTKAAIYSWHGCRIEVTGACEEYTAEETPMAQYANVHFALENLRLEASQQGREGPRVLVVGPNNAGKTSLVKILTAYALRVGGQPMVINTDPREPILSVPGSLTATPFASIIDVEQGWGSSPTSTSNPVPVKLPLCYFYGLQNPEDNVKLFKPILSRLALAATSRVQDDPDIKQTGMIIDTPGIISQGKEGYEIISHIVSEFQVNTILVLGSERLSSEMNRRFSSYTTASGDSMKVVKLDKSGGCVDREDAYMQETREAIVKEYYFGDAKTTLSPHTQIINFDDAVIYKIKDSNAATFMPGGVEAATDKESYEKVEPVPMMLHCLLAVMYASVGDSQDTVRDASVMGFVYVTEVDEKKRRLRVLAPMNTRISDRPMIWGPEAETVSLIG